MSVRFVSSGAAVALASLALVACGGDEEGAAGAASVIPADAPLYIEAIVNPEGEVEESLRSFAQGLGALPLVGQIDDPEALIATQLDSALADAGVDVTFTDDIQPWLGERLVAGYFFEQVDGDLDPSRIFVALETTDEDAARNTLAKIIESDTVEYEEREYDGVAYFTSAGSEYAVAIFDGNMVLTTLEDFELAVDTSRGGESLADSDELAETLGQLDENRLAALYLDFEALLELAAEADGADAEDFQRFQEAVPGLLGSSAAGLGVEAGQVFVESATPQADGAPQAGGTELLASAPGDVLGVLGIADLGGYGDFFVDTFEAIASSDIDTEHEIPDDLRAAFDDEVGVAFDEAMEALGGGTLWARGELPAALVNDEIEVGGQVEIADEEVASKLLERLGEQIADESGGALKPPVAGGDTGFSIDTMSGDDLPFANFAFADGVVTYGFFRDRAAAEASAPGDADNFGGTEAFGRAEELLGSDFELIGAADVGSLASAAIAAASELAEPGFSPEAILGDLAADKLGVLATGVRYEGDYLIQRLSLGIESGG